MAERARSRAAKAKKQKRRSGKANGRGKGDNSLGLEAQDETYLLWLPKIEVAQARYDKAAEAARTAKSELGQVYKGAEADGCHRDGIKEAFRLMKLDTYTVSLQAQATGRVLRLKQSPHHEQLQLFASVQPPPVNPFLAGQQTGREAGDINECPHQPGSADFQLWHDGYASGQEMNFEQLRGNA
jgi:hypothetical protein